MFFYILISLITPFLSSNSCAAEKLKRLPNIIYFLADDLGYAELGCYGQKWIKTPNIDTLAAQGMRFTQHYSGNAVCAPSRCCLMTGKHPGHSYVRDNQDFKATPELRKKLGWEFLGQLPIPAKELTMAEMLQSRGYATAAIGKWGLGHTGTTGDPNKQGIDLFYGFNSQRHAHNHYPRFLWRNDKKEILPGNNRTLKGDTFSQDRFTEEAMAFMKKNRDRPFFLYLPFAIPHAAIQVPDDSLKEYQGKIPEESHKHHGYIKHPTPRAGYAAMITHLDKDIGRIMALLKALGLEDNTLVIFTSDNGPTGGRIGGTDSAFFQSAGPLRGLKGSLYEGGIRIPMIARWPGKIKPSTESDLPCAFWDVMPTVAEVCSIEAPRDIDGISFTPTLFGHSEKQKKHDYLYWEFAGYGGQQAIRRGDWKAIRTNILRKKNKAPLKIQLYNLKEDIGEAKDVADQHPEIVAQMKTIMKEGRTRSSIFKFGPLDRQ